MRFFKILVPGFKTELGLPLDFCSSAAAHFSATANVATYLGEWTVNVRSEGGRFYLYGNGWNGFITSHDLQLHDFLLFKHSASFRFLVNVFNSSACEKLHLDAIVPPPLRPHHPINPTFQRKLSAHSGREHVKALCRLYIPTKLWKAYKLYEKSGAVLKFAGSSRVWLANLTFYADGVMDRGYDRFAVAEGWYEFVSENNLSHGDECHFEIIVDAAAAGGYPDNTIIINVTKVIN